MAGLAYMHVRPKSPRLRTAARAVARRRREEEQKVRDQRLQEHREQMLEEQRRKEELEIKKQRQQTVFKAQPIRKYVPLPVVKKRPLTDPISPRIKKRQRLES